MIKLQRFRCKIKITVYNPRFPTGVENMGGWGCAKFDGGRRGEEGMSQYIVDGGSQSLKRC